MAMLNGEGAIVPVSFGRTHRGIVALKVCITLACFWYLFRRLDIGELRQTLPGFDFRWALVAVLLLMLQIPLVALRWLDIARVVAALARKLSLRRMIMATAIGQFFGQVLPLIAGDGLRVWLLAAPLESWQDAATSVVIDRCIGIGLLFAFAFVILLLPSDLGAFDNYRPAVLAVLAAVLLVGLIVLVFGARLGAILARRRGLQWIGALLIGAHRSSFGPRGAAILGFGSLIHCLTIVAVWSLGRAQGLTISVPDAAVLFAVMVGVALFPLTIGGWGLRELAMVSLFGNYGLTPGRALVFSMYFGLACIAASLPGAAAWFALMVPRRTRAASSAS